MSKQTFTMIDDVKSAFKLLFDSPEKSIQYQEYKISQGYEHHQDEPVPKLWVYTWQNSQQIGVFKNEEEYLRSGLR